MVTVTNPLMMGVRKMTRSASVPDGGKLMQVAEKLSELKEVIYLVILSGRYDIMIEVFCRDHEELLSFMTEKLSDSGRRAGYGNLLCT